MSMIGWGAHMQIRGKLIKKQGQSSTQGVELINTFCQGSAAAVSLGEIYLLHL